MSPIESPIKVESSREKLGVDVLSQSLTQELEKLMEEGESPKQIDEHALEDMIKKRLEKVQPSDASTSVPSSSAPSMPSTPSTMPGSPLSMDDISVAARRQLEEQEDKGEFEIRGSPLGNFWSNQVLNNLGLREGYKQLKGPGLREKQAAFRKAWAQGLWDIVERSKTHDKWLTTSEGVKSEFVPVTRWIHLEGGGQAALRGLHHMIDKAKRENRVDELFEVHPDTGRLTVALPRKHKNEMSGDTHTFRCKANAKAEIDVAQKKQNAGQSAGEAQVAQVERGGAVGAPAAVEPPAGKAVKREPSKDGEKETKKDKPAAKKAKGSPRQLGATWKDLSILKLEVERATASSFGVQRNIEINKAEWAKQLPEYQLMMASLKEFDDKVALHKFWTDVFCSTTVLSTIKKLYTEADMTAELNSARASNFLSIAGEISRTSLVVQRTVAASKR